jgi:hypothetical protein
MSAMLACLKSVSVECGSECIRVQKEFERRYAAAEFSSN